MKIGTIIFAYHRSDHIRKVIDALSENRVLPEKLYIFQDGIKESTNVKEWKKVNHFIQNIGWCETNVQISGTNKGLAKSIIEGVNYVLQECDAVIVLEDDCVPHPQFMEYMVKALEKYENKKEVYHIGASAEPANPVENGTDAYFLGRINSHGWGTWKDRWEKFSNDYTMIGRIKADKELSGWLSLWGEDLESHVIGNVYGKTNSWAAFWALTVIMRKGFCMSPYESLIHNIGFDGSGVHCGVAENTLRLRPREKRAEIILPENVEFVKDYEKSFACYHRWTSPEVKNMYYKNTAFALLKMQKSKKSIPEWLTSKNILKIAIWGKGELCDYLIDESNDEVTVEAIIESSPKDKEYKNIPVISRQEIPQDIPLVIVVPGYDIDHIKNMIDDTALKEKMIAVDELVEKVRKDTY